MKEYKGIITVWLLIVCTLACVLAGKEGAAFGFGILVFIAWLFD